MEAENTVESLKQRIRELEDALARAEAPRCNAGEIGALSHMSSSFQRLMADNVPDLIWAKDMDDRYIFANKAICRILIMCDTTDEALGQTDVFFAGRERSRGYLHTFGEICVNSDQVVKATRKPGRFIEEGFVRGSYLVLDVHKAPLFDETGTMIGTVGCGRDITRERAFEQELVKAHEQFTAVLDNLYSAVYVADMETFEILFVNRAAADFLGRAPEDITGGICWQVFQKGAEGPCSFCTNSCLVDGEGNPTGVHVAEFYNSLFGRTFEIHDQAIKWPDGRIVRLEIATDISEQKKAEKALEQSEKKYRTLFDGNNDAIVVHPLAEDGYRPFVEVNDIACARYGFSREAFKGLTLKDISRDNRSAGWCTREELQALLAGGTNVVETVHRNSGGHEFPVEISSRVFDFYGEPMILSAIRDVTDRKRHEQDREDALKFAAEQEKYALVGQIAGKMSHDFNNILMAIMGHAEISALECREERTAASLGIIIEQVRRGKILTQNLVAFAKDQEPQEAFFNINEKIELVLNLLRDDLKPHRVTLDLQPDVPEILADPGMIEHALVNLIQNSIHAMSLTPEPALTVSTRADKETVLILVRDNGCGIPACHLNDIFTPSFTLKGSRDKARAYRQGIKGTGYGMSNVKKYMDKHHGKVQVESRPGEGTRITLSMPVIRKELTNKEIESLGRRETSRGKRILLVEDEPEISGVLTRVLGSRPFFHDVVVAPDGEMAIKAFESDEFDLVSLDYRLPGGLSGLDIYRYIRQRNSSVPILFVSGNIEFLESMKDLKAEDSNLDYLSKPCSNRTYADKVNTWLERPKGEK